MNPKTIRRLKILASLGVAALVIHTALLISSGIALRNARAELRAAGRPMTPKEIIPADVLADENAAPLYESAFALLRTKTMDGQDLSQAMGSNARDFEKNPNSAQPREAIKRLLADDTVSRVLDLIGQACPRPKCNFNLPYEQGAMLQAPHVNGMLTVGRFLSAKSIVEMQQGHADRAWNSIETLLRMADALREEPLLISALVRMALFKSVLETLETVSNGTPPDEDTALHLANFLAGVDFVGPYLLALDGERLFMGEWAYDQLHLNGYLSSHSIGPLRYRPSLQADRAYYLRHLGATAEEAVRPYWKIQPTPRGYQDPDFPWYATISRILTPNFSRSRISLALAQARLSVTQAGLALLRHKLAHGAYPTTLAELDPEFLKEIPLDPFTGQPLVYRPEDDGFVLYSLGENQKDDHGKAESIDNKKSNTCDIVWRSIH